MPKAILLGSASAIPTAKHENAHFVLQGARHCVLVDCPGSAIVRLQQAKVDLDSLDDIILTHLHPDHVSGVPALLMSLWLLGRRHPITIHGLDHTLNGVEQMIGIFGYQDWPEFFPVHYHRLAEKERAPVLENGDVQVFSSPVEHIVPTIGLRVEALGSGRVLAYSSDTSPCESVVNLAWKADVLLHEATGEYTGHSSPFQAGEVAQKAGARTLVLIHYPPQSYGSPEMLDSARAAFAGEVKFAEDLMTLAL